MGRTARGVRVIALREDDGGRDRVVGAVVVDNDKHLVTITERGFGKRSPFDDFRTMANRGGFGVRCHNITEKTGLLTGIAAVHGEEDLMMITDQGTIIRTPASDLSILSRSAGGVIVMRLPEDQYVANFTVVAKEEKDEEEIESEEIGTEEIEEIEEIEATEAVEVTEATEVPETVTEE